MRALASAGPVLDDAAVRDALERWSRSPGLTRTDRPMLAAARVEATLGEICNALRAEWGEYTEPARF